MRLTIPLLAFAALLAGTSASPTPLQNFAPAQGVDISHWQGTVNFTALMSNAINFVYIKATEGTSQSYSRDRPVADTHRSLIPHPHSVPGSEILGQLCRRDERGTHPWSVPLRAPGLVIGGGAGPVLHRARRGMARERRVDLPRRARHRM